MMNTGLIQNWRLIVWRGILAVLLGLASFFWPGLGGKQLFALFGLYALADGLITTVTALREKDHSRRWWVFLLEGLAGVVVGAVALSWPGITRWLPVVLIAGWALLTGLLEMIAAVRLRDSVINEWLLVWGGALSFALGVLAFFQPRPGDSTLIWGLGAYGLSFGFLLLVLGLGLRRRNLRSDRHFLRTAYD